MAWRTSRNTKKSCRRRRPERGGQRPEPGIAAAALQAAGFGVLLPAWWTRKGGQPKLAARPRASRPGLQGAVKFSLNDAIRLDWEVALGKETRSEPRVRRRAEDFFVYKAPYDRKEHWQPEYWICTKEAAVAKGVSEEVFLQPLLD